MNKPSSLKVPSLETLFKSPRNKLFQILSNLEKHFDQKVSERTGTVISSQGIIQPLVVRRHPELLISMNWLPVKEDGVP